MNGGVPAGRGGGKKEKTYDPHLGPLALRYSEATPPGEENFALYNPVEIPAFAGMTAFFERAKHGRNAPALTTNTYTFHYLSKSSSLIFSARGVILFIDVCSCSMSVWAWVKCCETLPARSARRERSVSNISSSRLI